MNLYKKEFTKDIYTHFKYYYETKGVVIITDDQIAQYTNVTMNNYATHDQLIKAIDFKIDENLTHRFYSENYIHIGTKLGEISIYEPERGYISDNQKEMLISFIEELKRVQEEEPYKEFDFIYLDTNYTSYRTKDIDDMLAFATVLDTNNNKLHKDTRIIGWTKEEFLNLPFKREEQLNNSQENKKR